MNGFILNAQFLRLVARETPRQGMVRITMEDTGVKMERLTVDTTTYETKWETHKRIPFEVKRTRTSKKAEPAVTEGPSLPLELPSAPQEAASTLPSPANTQPRAGRK